jgi:hypothetical protein
MTFVTLTGCDSQRRWPTSTPTNSPIAPPSVNAPPNTPTAISSATPGRVLTPKESCEAWVGLFDRDVPRLTMTPPAPRGGERVRLTGSGLVPGAYTASVGVPQTEATLTSVRTVATVDVDGTLDVNFVMPSQVDGHCLLVALHRQGTPPRFSTSNP